MADGKTADFIMCLVAATIFAGLEISSRAVRIIRRDWWLAAILGVLVLYWEWVVRAPSPGKAVALLGLAVVIMTIQPPMTAREKLIWVFLAFGLFYTEIRTIEISDENHRSEFRSIAGGIQKELSSLDQLSASVGIVTLQNTSIERKIDVNGKPQVIVTQVQTDIAAKQLLLSIVPIVVRQLQELALQWYTKDDGIMTLYQGDSRRRSASDDDRQRLMLEMGQKRSELARDYAPQIETLMVNADFIRQELLQRLPPSEQSVHDRNEAVTFARESALGANSSGELKNAASYLSSLAQRVAETK
jgi:hypothetical protein